MRNDTGGKDFDLYGTNPEPVYYILWHSENNKEQREEYLTWIKWTKEKGDAPIAYFLSNKSDAEIDFEDVGDYKNKYDVFRSSLGYRLIKIER